MGKSSVAVNRFIERPTIAADLCNGILFNGRQVVKAADLTPWKGESQLIVKDKDEKEKLVHRFRDAIFKWRGGPLVAVLAVENQSYVNYQMPLRNMLYDALAYEEQARLMWAEKGDKKQSKEEFLSEYYKDSKLLPVITLVFYYDSKEWDGSVDLYGMLDMGEDVATRELFKRYISNYQINLVDAKTAKEEYFQTQIRYLIGVIKRKGDKQDMERYIKENEKEFKSLEESTYDAMGAVLGKEKLFEQTKKIDEEGRVDMCPAVQGFYDEGLAEGLTTGKSIGAMEKLKEISKKKFNKGFSIEDIASLLEESVELITKLVNED